MRKLFYLGIAAMLLVRCNDDSEPSVKTTENYLPLAIGNYWIYENYIIDSLGNETIERKYNVDPLGNLNIVSDHDSVIITRDTSINGEKYFVFEFYSYQSFPELETLNYKRDSSGYIINNEGTILFSVDNFIDTLSKINYTLFDYSIYRTSKMEKPNHSITVPVGTFTVLDNKYTLEITENTTGNKKTKYMHSYYAKDIGKILSNGISVSLDERITTEQRLVRYNVIGLNE